MRACACVDVRASVAVLSQVKSAALRCVPAPINSHIMEALLARAAALPYDFPPGTAAVQLVGVAAEKQDEVACVSFVGSRFRRLLIIEFVPVHLHSVILPIGSSSY